MLTESGCAQRQQNLLAMLPRDVDWVLIGDPRHVQYFCGFRPNPVSFSATESAILLIQRDGTSVLMADNFTRRTAADPVYVSREEIAAWYDHKHSVINRDHCLRDLVEQQLRNLNVDQGLIEAEAISADVASVIGNVRTRVGTESGQQSTGSLIRQLRRCKLPDEIELLQRCMDAGAAGQQAAFQAVRPGVTEIDVYFAVQSAAQQNAGRAAVVYGDFRATNASHFKAGGLPTDYVLQAGDLFILDFSVVIAGYRSDFTNTVAVGTPSTDQLSQADACIAALLKAEETLRVGESCSDVFAAADKVLVERGFAGLPHHAGHGLGMEHPEPPILVPESVDTLRSGDVITLEPGLYVEGTGGMRFEHNYLMTDQGARRLSHHHLGLQSE